MKASFKFIYEYIIKFSLIIFFILFSKKIRNFIIKIIHPYTNDKINQLIKGKNYINICLENLLIQKINITKIKKPLISVVIPLYNCQQTINSSIRSIQNQNFSEIEIILVNDFSKDNTSYIISKFQKQDNRIQIINNNKSMGTLYSRSLGVLLAKGEYILTLDNDDMFFVEDIFYFLFKIGIEDNFDIIEFNSLFIDNYSYDIFKMRDNLFSNHKNNLILNQPKLGMFPFLRKGKYNDINIWGKYIKNDIYKKGINLLGKKRYSYYICWAEDTIIIFIIFNIANSFKYVNKYGIIHLWKNTTASFTESDNNKLFSEIILLNVIFEFSHNNKYKNISVYFALLIKERYNIKELKNKKIFYILVLILQKIISCKYITKLNKKKIRNEFKTFLNLKCK